MAGTTVAKNFVAKKTFQLTLVSIIANFLGFLIPIYIGYEYGVSKNTDDFFLSYAIITFSSVVFMEAVRSVSVPFLKERIDSPQDFNTFVSTVFYFLLLWTGVIVVTIFFITLALYAYTKSDLLFYLSISTPIFLFMVLNAFFYGVLNSLNKFYLAEMSPFSRGLIIFAFIYLLSDKLGVAAIIIGYIVGEASKFLHLLYVVNVPNRITISKALYQPHLLRSFLNTSQYQIYSSAISSSYPFIARTAGAFLALGSVTLIEYGDRLFMIFNVLLNSFLVVILSKWSTDSLAENFDLRKLHSVLKWLFFVCVALLAIVAALRTPIVTILYPKISPDSQTLVATILSVNMIGFVFNSMNQVVNRAFIAQRNTRVLFTSSVIKVIINIALTVLLGHLWGVEGIVGATVFVHFFGFALNYILFVRNVKKTSLSYE